MSWKRTCRTVLIPLVATGLLLACGCGDDDDDAPPPLPGKVSGTITYGGSETGQHMLAVAALVNPADQSSYVAFAMYTVTEADLDPALGQSYVLKGIQPGQYYISALWDLDDDLAPDIPPEPAGMYGGIATPVPVEVSTGTVTPGIDFELQ
jgi:hypothetical protein